jgi:hypothetical protein
MVNIDGYARVITDENGKIIDVTDYHWDHDQLYACIGRTEIMDYVCDIESSDAEVLIPLTYFYQEGKWIGADWCDPEQCLNVVAEYVLRWDFKKKYLEDIKKANKDQHELQYVDDMIKNFEEIYKEKVDIKSQ